MITVYGCKQSRFRSVRSFVEALVISGFSDLSDYPVLLEHYLNTSKTGSAKPGVSAFRRAPESRPWRSIPRAGGGLEGVSPSRRPNYLYGLTAISTATASVA